MKLGYGNDIMKQTILVFLSFDKGAIGNDKIIRAANGTEPNNLSRTHEVVSQYIMPPHSRRILKD